MCVYIARGQARLNSSCKPLRCVQGCLGREVGLEDFHLDWFGKGGEGEWEWGHAWVMGIDNWVYVCEAVTLPLMKRERRCRQTGSRSHAALFLTLYELL